MTGEHLGVTSCAYADMDEDQDGFTIRGDWAAPGAQHILGHYRLADFGTLAVRNLGAGLPLVINDNLYEIAPEEAATFQAIGIGATICMPLVKEGRLTALMAIHHQKAHRWTDYELAVITEVTERSWAHIERVRSEAAVREGERRFREELTAKVAEEVTARMRAEQALLQAQKLEAIGNLTGGIAHDFNNLLMAILGNLELLRKRLPGNEAGWLRLVDTATEGARRGSGLTSRMLAFARKQDLRTERVNVGQLVAGMAELMSRSLGQTITVDIRIDPRLPPVETDPNQLEAALLNLAVNARDAMAGSGPIRITAHEATTGAQHGLPTGRYVCLALTDAGEGMDEATLKRATEPFFTTKGVGKGTGLGLSMVQGLALQSGGNLVLRSAPGEGTTAEIWLPACAAEETAAEMPITAPPTARAQNSGAFRILAVDDDPLILMSIVDMLEDLGHSVASASSGQEALDCLANETFDLVMTDYAMPHMTGAEFIREARRRHPGLPAVLATGYAEMPCDDIEAVRLAKPFTQADLTEALGRVVGG
jgi:signal transduction histidine kinase